MHIPDHVILTDEAIIKPAVRVVLNDQMLANADDVMDDLLLSLGQGEASWHRPGAWRSGTGADKGGWDHPGGDGPADPHLGGDVRADQVWLCRACPPHLPWAYLEKAAPTKARLHGPEKMGFKSDEPLASLRWPGDPQNGIGTTSLPWQPPSGGGRRWNCISLLIVNWRTLEPFPPGADVSHTVCYGGDIRQCHS